MLAIYIRNNVSFFSSDAPESSISNPVPDFENNQMKLMHLANGCTGCQAAGGGQAIEPCTGRKYQARPEKGLAQPGPILFLGLLLTNQNTILQSAC